MAVCHFFVVLAILNAVFCNEYSDNETVIMYVNKVGPYFNPHETYHYYQLPVCRPKKIEHKSLTLGEVLDGDRMALSMYSINYKSDVAIKELCRVTFQEDDLQLLRDAIEDLYYFEFVLDEIPIRGFIGHLEEGGFLPHTHKVFLWAHLSFNIEYNGKHIIYANVSTKEKEPVNLDDVTAPLEVAFTYSVKWHSTDLKFEQRGQRMRDNRFFPKTLEIHWLSIINSMVLVFLLIGFVVIILRKKVRTILAEA
ncbi:hypothetical protein DPMN_183198 [Dreissena polymorpha]|uniref:Transmembrane 9 superfamily member n=1 Tax=Dreissena polymorpha TaxID=45954 RepID=A0A9D4I657_DREPO|nr:hypothetical protein DPMN_183198 [Dreissena polymorpha]